MWGMRIVIEAAPAYQNDISNWCDSGQNDQTYSSNLAVTNDDSAKDLPPCRNGCHPLRAGAESSNVVLFGRLL